MKASERAWAVHSQCFPGLFGSTSNNVRHHQTSILNDYAILVLTFRMLLAMFRDTSCKFWREREYAFKHDANDRRLQSLLAPFEFKNLCKASVMMIDPNRRPLGKFPSRRLAKRLSSDPCTTALVLGVKIDDAS